MKLTTERRDELFIHDLTTNVSVDGGRVAGSSGSCSYRSVLAVFAARAIK